MLVVLQVFSVKQHSSQKKLADALRGLTYASHPAGVSAYFLRCFVLYNHIIYRVIKPLLWLLIGVKASRTPAESGQLRPQDKESFDAMPSHERKSGFLYRGSGFLPRRLKRCPKVRDWPERKSTQHLRRIFTSTTKLKATKFTKSSL
ncbi:hypothetical protein [Lentibacillus sp. CBA3610]|uniref:hypothetical protein n=1 Tax=Lentibacillus sp. CBA3610 TaxID=2518176 RepID=UPI0015952FA8|nr:hypothetical protein [Lentibacillus sp. CBA3610]QKY71211.1 hypothetical protein Len3610_18060 [Lentibacillus sp. CBA3610]